MAKVASSNDAGDTGGLVSEVTSLLKSIRLQGGPQIKAYNVMKIGDKATNQTLLDGGATHCLRMMETKQEWNEAEMVKVQLAAGEIELKLHPKSNTLLSSERVQSIIPMCKLTQVGYEVAWTSSGCVVKHPVKGALKVTMQQGCPTIGENEGKKLMKEIEENEMKRASLRAVIVGQQPPRSEEEQMVDQLHQLFPEVPHRILERIPGRSNWDASALPFNRHRRRQIQKAKCVVVHLFAGKEDPCWKEQEKNGTVVVCLDVLGGSDLLHNDDLAGWLEWMAKSGHVDLWLSGPPCRTVSALRCKQDEGPPQLRSRSGPQRFGLTTLSTSLQEKTDGDSVMWLRSLWWMWLSHQAKPDGEYLMEQPRDPEEWCNGGGKDEKPKDGYPSFMVWPESVRIMKELRMEIARIDQGSLGHQTRKPTMLATNIAEVMEIDGLQCNSYDPLAWDMPLQQGIQKSLQLSAWAPGLKQLLCKVIHRRGQHGAPEVKTLTVKDRQEIQAWQDHHRAGHLPFRKDCPVCLISAGKSRQHRRVVCPTSYCLSLDVCGPFCPGTDQEETGCRYGLIAVYTVPVDAHGSPLPQGLVELQTGRVGEVDEDQEQHDESPAVGQDERILEEAAEDEEQDLSEAEIKQVEINEEKWKEFIKGTRAQAVRNITFGVPLRSREAGEVVKATSRILAKVKAMQLPILRLHTDRAREFAGSRFQRWLADRDLFHTMCGGDEPQSNARAEREVQAVKSSMRTLLLAAKAPTHFWPLALRQSVELRHRQQLRSLGVVLPEVLPFGCRAIVKRKTWHNRADPFRWPMMKVRLWGPAQDMAASSRGDFVQGSDGKFFRSTVVKMPDAIAQDGPLHLDQHQGELQEELPEPGNLPGGEEDGRDQGRNEQQEPSNEEQDVSLLEDPGLKPDQGETPCQFDRWCVDPREGIGGGSSSRTKGMDGLFNMDLGLEMEEITDREVLMLQPTKASKRRYHGKCPPRNEDIDGVAARKVAIDEAEDYKKQVGEERMEDVMVQQLFTLEKWIKSVSEAITSGKVDEEEIKLAVRAREETIAMEAMLQERKVCKIQMEQNEQQVLQTRSVGMDEVKKDLEAWTPVFAEEVKSLTAEALEPIDEKQFHEILKGNYDVECLPMKAIATLKPPNRKKGRVVVCGNFSSEKEGEELYNAAGGVDSVTIRTLLNLATHRGWTAATIDVKGAFLQAPRRTATSRVTIGEPPPILVTMGLTKPNERWVIKHALYGLQESPGDWGYHRDKKLVAAQWQLQGCNYRMVQTAERHVWKIVSDDEEGPHGFVLTYVDDMLILGNPKSCRKGHRGDWQLVAMQSPRVPQ